MWGLPGPHAPAGASPAGSLHFPTLPTNQTSRGPPAPQDKYWERDPALIFNRGARQPNVPSAAPGRPCCPSHGGGRGVRREAGSRPPPPASTPRPLPPLGAALPSPEGAAAPAQPGCPGTGRWAGSCWRNPWHEQPRSGWDLSPHNPIPGGVTGEEKSSPSPSSRGRVPRASAPRCQGQRVPAVEASGPASISLPPGSPLSHFFCLSTCTDEAGHSFLPPVLPSALPPEKLGGKKSLIVQLVFYFQITKIVSGRRKITRTVGSASPEQKGAPGQQRCPGPSRGLGPLAGEASRGAGAGASALCGEQTCDSNFKIPKENTCNICLAAGENDVCRPGQLPLAVLRESSPVPAPPPALTGAGGSGGDEPPGFPILGAVWVTRPVRQR